MDQSKNFNRSKFTTKRFRATMVLWKLRYDRCQDKKFYDDFDGQYKAMCQGRRRKCNKKSCAFWTVYNQLNIRMK